MAKLRVKKGDNVVVITGRDKGKRGEVLRVFPDQSRAIVQGVNLAKRHTRPRMGEPGGIVEKELTIHVSNIAHIDPQSRKPTRVGYRQLGDGRKVRWRQIFRSNHLGHVTEADIAILRSLGVRSAFDFRGTEERVTALCGIGEIAVHSLPIEPTVVASLRARAAAGTALSSIDAVDVMRDSYRDYVRHNTPSFRALFGHLLELHGNARDQRIQRPHELGQRRRDRAHQLPL